MAYQFSLIKKETKMKVIEHNTKANSSGVPFEEYIFNTGYKFIEFEESENIAPTFWTQKGKPVKPDSVTFKRGNKAIEAFINSTAVFKL